MAYSWRVTEFAGPRQQALLDSFQRCSIHPVGNGVAHIQLRDVSELAGELHAVEHWVVSVSEDKERIIADRAGTRQGKTGRANCLR